MSSSPLQFLNARTQPHSDTDRNHADECVVGAVNAFTEKDDLRSAEGIDIGISDVNAFIVVALEVLKIVAIRNIIFGRWPLSRRIHNPSIIVQQPNKISLLQARQTFCKKFICALVAKDTINVV